MQDLVVADSRGKCRNEDCETFYNPIIVHYQVRWMNKALTSEYDHFFSFFAHHEMLSSALQCFEPAEVSEAVPAAGSDDVQMVEAISEAAPA